MATEDTLSQELADVLNRIMALPRPKVREQILWGFMQQAAKILGVEVKYEK